MSASKPISIDEFKALLLRALYADGFYSEAEAGEFAAEDEIEAEYTIAQRANAKTATPKKTRRNDGRLPERTGSGAQRRTP